MDQLVLGIKQKIKMKVVSMKMLKWIVDSGCAVRLGQIELEINI